MLKENALVRVKYTEGEDTGYGISKGDTFRYVGITVPTHNGLCALCKPIISNFDNEDYFFYLDQLEEVKI